MSIETINGQVIETYLNNIKIGGKTSLYAFEGGYTNNPRIAYLIEDEKPSDLPNYAYFNVYDEGDIALWTQKVISQYHPEIICLRLNSIDPNGTNASKETAKANVLSVLSVIGNIPLIVWGCNNLEKNTEVISYLLEEITDYSLTIGPIEQENYKIFTASAIKNNHKLIANSPIDVNMAKQLNILLENEGLKKENILIDPTVSALGYGIEYSYSIIERIRLASLTQNDTNLQMPIICNIGRESWKVKEASELKDNKWGNDEERGILWEASSALSLITAGADIVVMLNPKAMQMVKETIEELA